MKHGGSFQFAMLVYQRVPWILEPISPEFLGRQWSGPCSHRRLRYCPQIWQGEATAKTKQLETIFSKCDGVAGATAVVVSKSPTGLCKRFPSQGFGNHRWVILTWRCFNSFWNRDSGSWSWSVWTKLLPHPMGIPSASTWDPDAGVDVVGPVPKKSPPQIKHGDGDNYPILSYSILFLAGHSSIAPHTFPLRAKLLEATLWWTNIAMENGHL